MEELYKGKALALYSQVALFDAEDIDAYPQWTTGTERTILGPKGVAVSALADAQVELIVCRGKYKPEGLHHYISGEIEVGNSGVLIGNVVAATIARIPWPSGRTIINVYGNATQDMATQIVFVLESAER